MTLRYWRSRIPTMLLLAVMAGTAPMRPAVAGDDSAAVAPATNRVTIKDGIVILRLDAADQRNAGIVTAHPAPAPGQRIVTGFARVLAPTALTALSSHYLDTTASVRVAEAKLTASRAAFERAKLLHRDQQNVSVADLQAAQANYAVDEAELAAARSRQSAVAAAARQEWGDVVGAALLDRTVLMTDLLGQRDFLVKVTLRPGETAGNAPPAASARLNDSTEIKLRFISAAPATDPQMQGISYFYEASAASGLLPGLHIPVSLAVEDGRHEVIVPDTAVVWLQGRAWIYLKTGATTFQRREIRPDDPAPDGGFIVRDVAATARIVVRGTQMLLSEEFRAQAPIED